MNSSFGNNTPESHVKPGLPPVLPHTDALPGLPPVLPPSGRFIAQLFVMPGLIILVVVLLMLVVSYTKKHEREPAYFLGQLDNANAEVRWRGASDLAQILKRPEEGTLRWKADVKFALDLTERLDAVYKELLLQEKVVAEEFASRTDADRRLVWRKLKGHRDTISFLESALGEFHMPVGAPVVCTILRNSDSPDINGNSLQRRKALWALMNMGDNLKGFKTIPEEYRANALAALKEEASHPGQRRSWARTALFYLDKSALAGAALQEVVRVDETLVACAADSDRFLRENVAMSFNFWDSDQAEATLLKLANDTGWGTLIRVEEND